MPVRRLPSNPNLDHLKHQARDLLRGHAARSPETAQRIREFHPHFKGATDVQIFAGQLSLSGAQLAIAREHGFTSWPALKTHLENPARTNQLQLPYQERIQDSIFRQAVDLLDSGDAAALGVHLKQHPNLAHQHIVFEGENYFRNPTLLEFVAENPVRRGTLPRNILEVARVILDAGAKGSALNETLMLVSTGSVARECHMQLPLIELLCIYGADPASAVEAAALHGEFESVHALIARGAPVELPIAAALGRIEDFRRLLPTAGGEERHLALALASQFGHVEVVRLLLDAGEDPNRYNPIGGHSHATPLHQAAGEGYADLVHLLIERGARGDLKDILWHATPADWARHAGRTELEKYLRAQEIRGWKKQEDLS